MYINNIRIIYFNYFKMLKIKTTILEKREDDSLMTKEAYFAMIDKSRASKATPVTIDELREIYLKKKRK